MPYRTWEVDCAIVVSVDLVDHVLEFGLRWILSKGSHDGTEFLGGDLSCNRLLVKGQSCRECGVVGNMKSVGDNAKIQ
jgi:hypothetical protein